MGKLDLLLPRVYALLKKHKAPEGWGMDVARDILFDYINDSRIREIARTAQGKTAEPIAILGYVAAHARTHFFDLYAQAPDAFVAILMDARRLVNRLAGTKDFQVAAALAKDPVKRDTSLLKELAERLSKQLGWEVTPKAVQRAGQLLCQLTQL